jgi:NADPH:quinone reductase-like Zn-dependent oxidoreductase
MVMANPAPETLSALAALVASGSLTVPVTESFELDRAAEAFKAFGAGAVGKLAIAVD